MSVPSGSALSRVALFRLSVGLAQGVLLYGLMRLLTAEVKVWPATDPQISALLLMPLLFAPLVAMQAYTHLRNRTLALWVGAVIVLSGGLGFYAAWRAGDQNLNDVFEACVLLIVFLSVGLFIAQALIVSAAADGKRIANYSTYFDIAWKQGVQVAASGAFVAAFWVLLLLGSALFQLIGLKFFSAIIEKEWFAYPATALALATAIHVTDVRPGIVRGIRTLALTLLSWLLPILALIVAGFVISLPFTGLQKLWDTNFATALVLVVMAALVILINASYQDGTPENAAPAVTKHSATLSALLLLPLAIIAAYGLSLRIGQYGWTTDRIIASMCVLVASCYAAGYAFAVLRAREGWLKRLELTNIATSFVVLAVLFALFSPVADPARISVNSQMARLEAGQITPEKFDYKYLRFDAGHYGIAALERLKAGEVEIAGVQERADEHLKLKSRGGADEAPTQSMLADNITVLTPDRALPKSFVAQNWVETVRGERSYDYPACLRSVTDTCDALVMDLNADGADEIVLMPSQGRDSPAVFQPGADGTWRIVARLGSAFGCDEVRAALREGRVEAATPKWSDIQVGEWRFSLEDAGFRNYECPSDR